MEKKVILFWIFASVLIISSFACGAVVSHSATQILAGTFASGNFTFLNNLFINGNVGIGTSNPTQKLTVVGNASVSGILNVAGNMSITGLTTMSGGTVLEARTSDPASPAVGRIWLRTDIS